MTFSFLTFGCKVNQYETEALKEALAQHGEREALPGEEADLYFVNTCAVTGMSERKDRKAVSDLLRDHPKSRVVVFGCSAQLHPEAYGKHPNVLLLSGDDRKKALLSLLEEGRIPEEKKSPRLFDYDDLPLAKGVYPTRSVLKIQDGCDRFCSYCVIPFCRGRSRSRRKNEVLSEARRLLSSGVKELVVSGIDVGDYHDPEDPSYGLASLLSDLSGLPFPSYRIRVSSWEVSEIGKDALSAYLLHPGVLVPHFHLPLQSGSNKVLKAMNRPYTAEEFLRTVEDIRSLLPDAVFSSDVITGFPGERAEDFANTLEVCRKAGFFRIHAFPYSERPGTKASRITEGKVPVVERRRRVKVLNDLSQEGEIALREKEASRTIRVLLDVEKEDGFYGYSDSYLLYRVGKEGHKVGDFVLLSPRPGIDFPAGFPYNS